MTIDSRQETAIHHRDGPAMVLAGPGSGKTTVITHRVEYLIRVCHIDPASILVITFSRAAAREMQERFLRLCENHLYPVNFGTFHAIFFQILKNTYGYKASQIAREEARTGFVRDAIRRLRIETDDEAELTKSVLSEISRRKNNGERPTLPSQEAPNGEEAGDPSSAIPAGLTPDLFSILFSSYQEFLTQNGLLDFDDMLLLTRDLFVSRPDILMSWQKKYRYLLVDEFQDINPIQYEVIRMLALPENNLFIVGDDDQSIYRFRGACPEIMLHFPDDYPDATTVLLSTNYRSVPAICTAAGHLISHNEKRYQKDIHASCGGTFEPVFQKFSTQREQNAFLIETIKRLSDEEGVPYDEMAVLYRTNAQPSLLLRQLCEANLPYFTREHIPCLYDHWIAQDVMTYIQLAMGDRSRASFLRIMNRPMRFLSRESLPYESVSFDLWRAYYAGDPKMCARLGKLEEDLHILSGMRPFSAINYIRRAIDYEGYLIGYAKERHLPCEELLSVLDELQEEAREQTTFASWLLHGEEIRENWKRPEGGRGEENPVSGVWLSTLHAAKGLEFDTVFLVDVCETVVPYKKASLPEDIEEERRLFYVGMTRAKRRLYLLSPAQIRNKDMIPSRYLSECVSSNH